MLTSSARETLRGVRSVIVDEIHALAATKRGAHLALSLERLDELGDAPPQRIGLSATQRPLEEIARFLGGQEANGAPRAVTIVDAGHRKPMELEVEVPVDDMAELSAVSEPPQRQPIRLGPAGIGTSPSQGSIWPSIHPRLLELIRAHRSTIVFVNARRLAERLAARLNELADEDLVRAHHGSLAREQRLEVEDALKGGTAPGDRRDVVASSSASTWARWTSSCRWSRRARSPAACSGSAGPATRSASPAGARSSRSSAATCSRWPWSPSGCSPARSRRRATRGTRSTCWRSSSSRCARSTSGASTTSRRRCDVPANFADLSHDVFLAVLDLLAGRYPSDGFAELRPRLVWDRAADDGAGARGRRPARDHLAAARSPTAACSACSCPTARASGELDEEMVYESRRGEVFLLGRVVVADRGHHPRPRGRLPRARRAREDALLERRQARPPDRARARDRRVHARAARRASASPRSRSCRRDLGLDERAARNLVAYLDEQAEATGAVPDDRTIVVERFRDELGDWRVCILSPFGQRVHAPWGLAIEQRLLDRFGPGAQVLWGDDGIVVRLPEAVDRIPVEDLVFDPDEIEDAVVAALPGTAMFASVFREASARALLLPRQRPGKRTPLWQQRQRSADLLTEAAKHPTFPMLLETTRECLRDVFDVPALREVMADLRSRRTKLVAVDTETASPFAQSLLFRWVAVFMYEGDAPLAERRAAALSLDRDLLRELLGTEELRELLDPRAIDEVELELQWLADGRHARSADGTARPAAGRRDRSARTRSPPASTATCRRGSHASSTKDASIRVKVGGEDRFAAVEDAAALRDALGTALPIGLPGVFTEPSERPLERLVARFARTHGPFEVGTRPPPGSAPARTGSAQPWSRCEAEGRVVHGRVPTGRGGARMGRRRGAATDPPAVARGAPQGGRAGRRSDVRAVPARVAGRRPAARRRRRAGRDDRSAAGRRDPRLDPGDRRAARARARLPRGRPRRAVRERRPGVGRRRVPRGRRRARHALLPRRARSLARSDLGRPPRRRGPRRDPRAPRRRGVPRSGPTSWRRRAPRASGSCSARSGTWCGPGEVTNDTLAPLRAFVQRRLVEGAGVAARASAETGRAPPGRAARRRRPVVARRAAPRSRRRRRPSSRTRGRSSCSTGTAS